MNCLKSPRLMTARRTLICGHPVLILLFAHGGPLPEVEPTVHYGAGRLN